MTDPRSALASHRLLCRYGMNCEAPKPRHSQTPDAAATLPLVALEICTDDLVDLVTKEIDDTNIAKRQHSKSPWPEGISLQSRADLFSSCANK